MKVGLCRHFPNIKQVIIPIFFHIVNGFSTGFAGGSLYSNEKLARGKTPRAGFLLLYTAFQPRDRLDMCIIVQTQTHILRDIREQHHPDSMTADEISFAENMQNLLQDAMNFEGSSEEKKVKALLATLGIDYDAITMEQFVNLIEVLKLSKHLKTPISQRGKTTMTHGKGKRKKH